MVKNKKYLTEYNKQNQEVLGRIWKQEEKDLREVKMKKVFKIIKAIYDFALPLNFVKLYKEIKDILKGIK